MNNQHEITNQYLIPTVIEKSQFGERAYEAAQKLMEELRAWDALSDEAIQLID